MSLRGYKLILYVLIQQENILPDLNRLILVLFLLDVIILRRVLVRVLLGIFEISISLILKIDL